MFLDCKGKPCPQPVVLTIQALASLVDDESLVVEVDNEEAVENLSRMAWDKNYSCDVEKEGGESTIRRVILTKNTAANTRSEGAGAEKAEAAVTVQSEKSSGANTVIVFSSEFMGTGNDELGRILMKSYIYALQQLEVLPKTMLFFNGGAKLTSKGSEVAEDISSLAARGVEVLTCGTCLDFYGIKDQLAVGGVTNMYSIAEKMQSADKVIRV